MCRGQSIPPLEQVLDSWKDSEMEPELGLKLEHLETWSVRSKDERTVLTG